MASARDPLISVIVPVYNVEDHVGACLQSLRVQSLTDFEVLVIDDGATDQSVMRARDACGDDPRFRIMHQENGGLSAARNHGLDLARGEFIAFVDSDDRVSPDYLMRLWQALDSSGADWVACAIRFRNARGILATHSAIHGAHNLAGAAPLRRYPLEDWQDVIRHFPSAWNKLYRHNLIRGLRFDEGTWFEDHGFFYRAARRTDHLLHLPEALYEQTRDRDGQITGADDERVFQQLAVLNDMRAIMQAPPESGETVKTGADQAFEQIASRLLFERSTALRDPERRGRFARQAAQWLNDQNLTYTPDWDPGIARCWELEMNGDLPLSVVIPWSGQTPQLLAQTLDSLARQHGPGREILIICDDEQTAKSAAEHIRGHPECRILTQPGTGVGHARNFGLDQARGDYVCFTDAGDVFADVALHDWTETMQRHQADLGISAYRIALPGEPPHAHSGFCDPSGRPARPHGNVRIALPPAEVPDMASHPGTRIFRRAFLAQSGLRFGPGPGGAWPVVTGTALRAQKITYTGWAGILVSGHEQANQLIGAGLSPWRMIRDLARLKRALTSQEQAQLPAGWHSRLLARAAREQLVFARNRNQRTSRLIFAAVTAAFGLWSGLRARLALRAHPGRTHTCHDPDIGPRMRRLADPLHIAQAQQTGHISAPSSSGTNEQNKMPPIFFQPKGNGRFCYYADFNSGPYANISFYDASGSEILFHLSLRQAEKLAVCNRRLGGNWGPEIQKPVAFCGPSVKVEIEFSGARRARVRIDDVEMFHFGNPIRRARFSGLNRIASVEYEGGIYPANLPQTSFAEVSLPADGRPVLAPGLQIMARLPADEKTHGNIQLHCSTGVALPATCRTDSTGTRLMQSVLPGRVWADLSDDTPLEMRLGPHAPALSLGRTELCRQIEQDLSQIDFRSDPFTAIQAIEHVRFGGLADKLSPGSMKLLVEAAKFYRVTDFLFPPGHQSGPPMAPPPLPEPPREALTEQLLARFHQTLLHAPETDPLDLVKTLLPADAALQQDFLVSLSDFFCRDGQDFEGLHHLAATALRGRLKPSGDPWFDSAILPFLILEGELTTAQETLWVLTKPVEGWIVTPAIAWVARHLCQQRDMPEKAREDLLYGILRFVEYRLPLYFERAQCQELITAFAALVQSRHSFADYLSTEINAAALRAYGLSPEFWARLEAAAALPKTLQPAKTAFDAIAAYARQPGRMGEAPQDVVRALNLFDQLENTDVPRFRRELLGPGQHRIPAGTAPAGDILPSPEAAMRTLAHPFETLPDESLLRQAGIALRDAYDDVPRAPYYQLQKDITHRFTQLVHGRDDPGPEPLATRTRAFLKDLRLLSGDRSKFVGLAPALALLRAFLSRPDDGADAATDEILTHLQALSPGLPNGPALPPALRMGLSGLQGLDHPKAKTALSLFEAPPQHLGPQTILPDPSPLFDTLVMVFSCHPNLDTRIPAMRQGWLSDLEQMGIPYVVVVGNGDGRRDGDVVHLEAPDDYEGLPQKTLAAIRWAHENTPFSHILKIDDDCFLNAPEFFGSLSYRKFDYYGRRLTRHQGQMDRAWHCEKSNSARGQYELDKSPEPSSYADGGSGWTLSRHAMAQVLAAEASPEGQLLIRTSFMEDKLLGDLLLLRGIHPANEDYLVTIRRRSHSTALPVARWVNSFDASAIAGIKLTHLDGHRDQQAVRQRLNQPVLRPARIWPSYQDAALGYQTNALEMVGPDHRLERACTASVAVVACMRNEMFMLPHFLAHYRRLGVEAFLIADNFSDDGTLEYLAEQEDVALFSVDTDYSLSRYGVAWQQALLAGFRVGKWSVVADADELLVWQKTPVQSLPELLNEAAFETADAARVFMLDMYPEGPLAEADFRSGDPFAEAGFSDREPFLTNWPGRGPYTNMPTWTSALRHRLIPGSRADLFVAQKIALLRYQPWMQLSAGLHFLSGVQLAPRELLFAHFKYNADFRRKAETEVARGQHFNDAEEYRKYLALISEGRDVIHDPDISVRWYDSAFARAHLDLS